MIRGMVVRLVEWRARSISDPAERLQFLQRKLGPSPPRRNSIRTFTRLPLLTTLGLAVAGIGLIPTSRRTLGLTLPFVLATAGAPARPKIRLTPSIAALNSPTASVPHVWRVEANRQFDLYSNGLRVENRFETSTQPRSYLAFSRNQPENLSGERLTQPAGIVFHTTESHLAPFEEDQTRMLKRDGEG